MSCMHPELKHPGQSEAGQATIEYASINAILALGLVVGGAGWPFTHQLFGALQSYIDLFFYALNVAIG